jgi:pyruvate formate lyase activating enzyme
MDPQNLGHRRAAALHRVPSRLEDDRRIGDARATADAGARDRAACGLRMSIPATCTSEEGGTTYCPSCENPSSCADWYAIRAYHLSEQGACMQLRRATFRRYQKFSKPFGPRRYPGALSRVCSLGVNKCALPRSIRDGGYLMRFAVWGLRYLHADSRGCATTAPGDAAAAARRFVPAGPVAKAPAAPTPAPRPMKRATTLRNTR